MSFHVRHSGTWKEGTPYARHSGTWKPWKQAWVRRNNTWVEFYSQSGNYTINIAHRANQPNDKVIIPSRRGYWLHDSQWGVFQLTYNSSTMMAATGLEISREDYSMLYDDGLVDIEPEVFFAEKEVEAQNQMGLMAVAQGSISPSDYLNGYTINAIIEISWDGYNTGRYFQVEILGHGVPLSLINSVAIYNGETLVRNLAANLANDRGVEFELNDGTKLTRWTWQIDAIGSLLPNSGTRRIIIT